MEGLDRIADGIDLDGGWTVTATGGPGLGGTVLGPAWAEAFFGDLVDGFGERVGESVRGKSPPGWELGGGLRGSFA